MNCYFTRVFTAIVSGLLFALCCAGCGTNSGKIPERPDKLGLEPVSFELPQAERWTLSNGLEVLYYYNDELPQVQAKIYFPGGQLYSPFAIPGLVQATGSQLREGSIEGISPDELDQRLDRLAATIESSFGVEYGTVGFSCLLEDFTEVFSLFAAVIRRPAFDEERLALWKKLTADGIRRRRDNPDTMASMAFSALVYGSESPLAKAVSNESIPLITREKMLEFSRLFVRPDGAKLAVTGAVGKEQLKAAIEQFLSTWEKGTTQLPPPFLLKHTIKPGIYLLERDFEQAKILLGHLGPKRQSAQQYSIAFYNEILGFGGFSSLLFQEIRTRLGLAYSVYGGFWPGLNTGVFQLSLATRNEQVALAVAESLALLDRTRRDLPDSLQFANAKSSQERSFVFNFANPGSIVFREAVLDLLTYPGDYDRNYLKNIRLVEPEEVKEVGKQWVEPQNMVIVVVGKVKEDELRDKLSGFNIFRFSFDTEPKFSH